MDQQSCLASANQRRRPFRLPTAPTRGHWKPKTAWQNSPRGSVGEADKKKAFFLCGEAVENSSIIDGEPWLTLRLMSALAFTHGFGQC